MKRFRNLPAIVTLFAGFVASVMMIINKYTLKNFLWILVGVMVGFYLVGVIVRFILDKIYRKEEEKQQELKRQQEEEEKARQEAENGENQPEDQQEIQ